jgi:NAD dependent epimerase/dehydratase family enzyme
MAVPAFALRALLGEMADMLLTGQRVVPAKALALGFEFQYPELETALRAALTRGSQRT